MTRMGSPRATAVGLFLVSLLASGCAGGADAAPGAPPPGNPPELVAMNPAVQQWFKRHEPERIAVNDALQQVQLHIDDAALVEGACSRLQQTAADMLAALPTPKHALDPQVVSGMEQFRIGAQQCLAGDLGGARQSIAAGIEARAAAEAELEELLEASDGSVR